MAMYLLFDSGCSVCTQIAKEVEDETSGKVTHRSLREPQVQKMLQTIKPDWQWEPMLLQTDENDQPRNLFCGLKMKLQFTRLLGIGKALYLYKKLRPQITTAQNSKIKQERRHFLQQAGGVTLGALTLGALPQSVKADEDTFTQVFLPLISSGNSQSKNIDAVNFGVLSSEEVKYFLDKAKKE